MMQMPGHESNNSEKKAKTTPQDENRSERQA